MDCFSVNARAAIMRAGASAKGAARNDCNVRFGIRNSELKMILWRLPSCTKSCVPPASPLDTSTRAFMEPRFGHDFSQVRVKTDSLAAASAQAVDALALLS